MSNLLGSYQKRIALFYRVKLLLIRLSRFLNRYDDREATLTKIMKFKNTDRGSTPLFIITPTSISKSQLSRKIRVESPIFPLLISREIIIPDVIAEAITVVIENRGIIEFIF